MGTIIWNWSFSFVARCSCGFYSGGQPRNSMNSNQFLWGSVDRDKEIEFFLEKSSSKASSAAPFRPGRPQFINLCFFIIQSSEPKYIIILGLFPKIICFSFIPCMWLPVYSLPLLSCSYFFFPFVYCLIIKSSNSRVGTQLPFMKRFFTL